MTVCASALQEVAALALQLVEVHMHGAVHAWLQEDVFLHPYAHIMAALVIALKLGFGLDIPGSEQGGGAGNATVDWHGWAEAVLRGCPSATPFPRTGFEVGWHGMCSITLLLMKACRHAAVCTMQCPGRGIIQSIGGDCRLLSLSALKSALLSCRQRQCSGVQAANLSDSEFDAYMEYLQKEVFAGEVMPEGLHDLFRTVKHTARPARDGNMHLPNLGEIFPTTALLIMIVVDI
jgi:hypothetical protein